MLASKRICFTKFSKDKPEKYAISGTKDKLVIPG
jgi:hypothetical protein